MKLDTATPGHTEYLTVTEQTPPDGYVKSTRVETVEWDGTKDVLITWENVRDIKQEIQTLTATVDAAKLELEQHLANSDLEQQEYEKIKDWADLYDTCTFAAKKMIVSQFIKSVYVHRDYTLEIEFNVSFEDFKTMATECEEQGKNKQPLVYVTA